MHQPRVDRSGKSVETSRFPVGLVSWYQAALFCNRLSEEEGLPAFYRLSPSKRGKLWKEVDVLGGPGYRLPTEAEWEYSCRAGTATPFSFGETAGVGQAKFDRDSAGPIHVTHAVAVGSFPANAFGLYDMHGNVAEWCSDWYRSEAYKDAAKESPTGPTDGDKRVIRGGSFREPASAAMK